MSLGDIIGSGSNTVIMFNSLKFTHTLQVLPGFFTSTNGEA